MVSAMVVVAFNEPEVPVIVTVELPTVAVLLAVSVSTLVDVAGLVANAAVTPVGKPEAASVTEPANGLTSDIVTVTVQVPPCGIVQVVPEGAIVKLPVDETTVPSTVVLAVIVPEVPVMVIVKGPTAAVALAVHVSTLPVVTGFVPNVHVTPEGRPLMASVTLPVNPPVPVIMTVSVAVCP